MPAEDALLEISRLQREAADRLFTLRPDTDVNPHEGDPDRDPAAARRYARGRKGVNVDD